MICVFVFECVDAFVSECVDAFVFECVDAFVSECVDAFQGECDSAPTFFSANALFDRERFAYCCSFS